MRSETRYVPIKRAKRGDTFRHYKRGTCMTMGWMTYEIISDPVMAFVQLKDEDGKVETWETEGLELEVEIPEEELQDKYRAGAKEVQKALFNELSLYECGRHEMWNAWLSADAYEVAQAIHKEEFKVIGVCYDPVMQKQGLFFDFGPEWNCGVVIEYPDGERYWCHWSSVYVDDMKTQDLG